jgi:CDP-diacylglycerol---serine O-phosphatidyltransferase
LFNKSSIPNLFTFANLFCGFISLGLSAEGEFKNAAILVIIGMIFDSMDGRMARILKVSSKMGLELDSLADVVTFGVAPAMLAYHIWFEQFELMGLMFTGLFPLFGAYRLARFNISASKKAASHFVGIPIPAAGGFVLLLVLFHKWIPGFVAAVILIGLCFLMVSKLKIPSFKNVHILNRRTIITILIICSTYAVITTQHKNFPYLIFIAIPMYIIFIVYQMMRKRK